MAARTALEAYDLAKEAKSDIANHEELCAERYGSIHETIREIKDWVKAGVFGVATICMALGGAMAHELYSNLQHPPVQASAK